MADPDPFQRTPPDVYRRLIVPRESPRDRALSRTFKLRHRLGSTGGIGADIAKPKGMRRATFDRKMDQIDAAEAVSNANLLRLVLKLTQRNKGRKS